jgi:hypothetical protein
VRSAQSRHRSGLERSPSLEWAARVHARQAVAYTIHHDPDRDRWYLTASWQPAPTPTAALQAALTSGVVGVDTNNDHYAAWRLDNQGNPIGRPRRFDYDLSGVAAHRDAQIRQATTRLQMISRFPTARLRTRLISMAAEAGITVAVVDPAYTSKWGAQHWVKPTSTPAHKTTRHEAASLVIGRRAQGFRARRRTSPPGCLQSDDSRHRNAPAGPGSSVCEGSRPPRTGTRTRSAHPPGKRTRGTSLPKTVRGRRDEHGIHPGSSVEEL